MPDNALHLTVFPLRSKAAGELSRHASLAMKIDKNVAIYVRVSTKYQGVDMQLSDFERYAKERGLNVFNVYEDSGVSGTRETRVSLKI